VQIPGDVERLGGEGESGFIAGGGVWAEHGTEAGRDSSMDSNEGKTNRIHRPYILRNPQPMAVSIPFEGDLETWLTKLEVYTPFDDDRMRDLDRWRGATDKERGDALYSALSVVAAMGEHVRSKPPLTVRFPRPLHRRRR
jgi:hypothetical protein